jgi:cell division control protein 6
LNEQYTNTTHEFIDIVHNIHLCLHTLMQLNKLYLEICKSSMITPAGITEFSNMCTVLNDQGILKLSLARDDKLKRVSLRVDEADITFALKEIRFFRNCLL